MKTRFTLIFCGFLIMMSCSKNSEKKVAVTPEEMKLIDRELFFGNPEKTRIRISPDGQYLSYLAPLNGVMNVFVGPIDDQDKIRPVTNDTIRGIRNYNWTYKTGHLLYTQDLGGDENFHIFLVDVERSEVTDLTPFETIQGPDNLPLKDENNKLIRPRANILSVSSETPDNILLQINKSNPSEMDVYSVNLSTKEINLKVKDEGFLQIVPDNQNNVRLATKVNPDGGQIVYENNNGEWKEYFNIPQEDLFTFTFIGFDKTNESVYMIDSRGRDRGALYSLNLRTNEKELIAESDKSDVAGATQNPINHEIDAYATNYLTTEWHTINKDISEHLTYLSNLEDGELSILSRTADDNTWVVYYDSPHNPGKYYRYNKADKKAEFILTTRPELENLTLAQTYPLEIKSRDNNTLVSYLTLPANMDDAGKAIQPLPTVLLVHGGPWGRDTYGFNSIHQWLANRGYAVLSVNFRGSTGFGKDFVNIAKEEWAGKMHDDLIDAVNYLIENKTADENKVGIMGGSYGGYATLVGLTFTPDVFACGVDIVGPSNLHTLLSTIPPYWKAFRSVFENHIGNPETEEGLALLNERSPINYVDSISKPLLIGQGANDPRVKQDESDQIVNAMKNKALPVTYILYPDEGHGFARPENRLSFFAVTEVFLSKHLGGKFQGIEDDFNNSSIKVVETGGLNKISEDKEPNMEEDNTTAETM